MRLHLSLALAALLFSAPGFAADKPVSFGSTPIQPPMACIAADKAHFQIAQLACCKAHKGVCGCRAGKIVCCDNTVSNEPGCACHGDEGIVE